MLNRIAQLDIPEIRKSGLNPHFGSKYHLLDDILGICPGILRDAGLAFFTFPISGTDETGVRGVLVDIESGEEREVLSYTVATGKSGPQAAMATITYCRRMAWVTLLNLHEPDDDGNTAQKGYDTTEKIKAIKRNISAVRKTKVMSAEDVEMFGELYSKISTVAEAEELLKRVKNYGG